MKDWQFWFIIVGLMQIHYDLSKSMYTLVITWLAVVMAFFCLWQERRES
jgi:hypothetical protein